MEPGPPQQHGFSPVIQTVTYVFSVVPAPSAALISYGVFVSYLNAVELLGNYLFLWLAFTLIHKLLISEFPT